MKTNRKMPLNYITFETPIGWLLVAESRDGIALVDFLGPDRPSKDATVSAVLKVYPGAARRRELIRTFLEKQKDIFSITSQTGSRRPKFR